MDASPAIKVLVAVTPAVREIAIQALQCDDFALRFCHSLPQAAQLLQSVPIDIAVGTLQFDESRLCSLLQHLRANPVTRAVPFIALTFWKEGEGKLSRSAVSTALHGAQLCGATEAINLPLWRQQMGDAAAFEQLRARIRALALHPSTAA